MRGRYFGNSGITLGEHFIAQERVTARIGKIFHMRVPGDIIAGTDGQDIAACWTERYNAPGLEAHTPGDYACLNLNVFTTELEGRQSTGDPHRPFVTVSYEGDGSDQPDAKAAAKSVELLRRFSAGQQPFLLATGFVRPHYPMVAPRQFFDRVRRAVRYAGRPRPVHQPGESSVACGNGGRLPPTTAAVRVGLQWRPAQEKAAGMIR
jgi:iduronate 2-sulfatase